MALGKSKYDGRRSALPEAVGDLSARLIRPAVLPQQVGKCFDLEATSH